MKNWIKKIINYNKSKNWKNKNYYIILKMILIYWYDRYNEVLKSIRYVKDAKELENLQTKDQTIVKRWQKNGRKEKKILQL